MLKLFVFSIKFLITLIITFASLELFFQGTEIFTPSIVRDDNTFGRTLIPNAKINLLKESYYLGYVNENGYLGPAYPKLKDKNTIRIALIGDSFVEGFQVFDKYHFRNISENKLNESYNGIKYEVLNFGRSGLDYRNMFIFYSILAKQYNPDIIILFLKNSDLLSEDNSYGPKLSIVNNELQIDSSFQNSSLFKNIKKIRFARKYSFYPLISAVLTNYQSGKTMKILFDKFYIAPPEKNISTKSDKQNNNILYELNKLVTQKISSEMSDNKKIIIVPISKLSDNNISLFKEYGIKILELDSIYSDLENKGINPFYWKATNMEGHWNHEAHKAIGLFIANYISRINLQ